MAEMIVVAARRPGSAAQVRVAATFNRKPCDSDAL
jgi:hypothetical protein